MRRMTTVGPRHGAGRPDCVETAAGSRVWVFAIVSLLAAVWLGGMIEVMG